MSCEAQVFRKPIVVHIDLLRSVWCCPLKGRLLFERVRRVDPCARRVRETPAISSGTGYSRPADSGNGIFMGPPDFMGWRVKTLNSRDWRIRSPFRRSFKGEVVYLIGGLLHLRHTMRRRRETYNRRRHNPFIPREPLIYQLFAEQSPPKPWPHREQSQRRNVPVVCPHGFMEELKRPRIRF